MLSAQLGAAAGPTGVGSTAVRPFLVDVVLRLSSRFESVREGESWSWLGSGFCIGYRPLSCQSHGTDVSSSLWRAITGQMGST